MNMIVFITLLKFISLDQNHLLTAGVTGYTLVDGMHFFLFFFSSFRSCFFYLYLPAIYWLWLCSHWRDCCQFAFGTVFVNLRVKVFYLFTFFFFLVSGVVASCTIGTSSRKDCEQNFTNINYNTNKNGCFQTGFFFINWRLEYL